MRASAIRAASSAWAAVSSSALASAVVTPSPRRSATRALQGGWRGAGLGLRPCEEVCGGRVAAGSQARPLGLWTGPARSQGRVAAPPRPAVQSATAWRGRRRAGPRRGCARLQHSGVSVVDSLLLFIISLCRSLNFVPRDGPRSPRSRRRSRARLALCTRRVSCRPCPPLADASATPTAAVACPRLQPFRLAAFLHCHACPRPPLLQPVTRWSIGSFRWACPLPQPCCLSRVSSACEASPGCFLLRQACAVRCLLPELPCPARPPAARPSLRTSRARRALPCLSALRAWPDRRIVWPAHRRCAATLPPVQVPGHQ